MQRLTSVNFAVVSRENSFSENVASLDETRLSPASVDLLEGCGWKGQNVSGRRLRTAACHSDIEALHFLFCFLECVSSHSLFIYVEEGGGSVRIPCREHTSLVTPRAFGKGSINGTARGRLTPPSSVRINTLFT